MLFDGSMLVPFVTEPSVCLQSWACLCLQKNYQNFDGFVILHGTDTMAYTASALSFMCEHLGKPIILTGSQVKAGTKAHMHFSFSICHLRIVMSSGAHLWDEKWRQRQPAGGFAHRRPVSHSWGEETEDIKNVEEL